MSPPRNAGSCFRISNVEHCLERHYGKRHCAALASELLGRIAGDGDLLDLRAALDDLGDLGIAQVTLDRVVLRQAVGAMQLDGVVGRAGGGARRSEEHTSE